MNKLPEKLTLLRKHYGYSQSYLANYLKVDVVVYMGYENGRTIPDFATLKKLAKCYGVSVDSLFVNEIMPLMRGESNNDVDKKNYSYLRNQTYKQKAKEFINHKWPVLVACCAFALMLIIFIVTRDPVNNMNLKQDSANTRLLSASSTSVAYVDRYGKVAGRGDNSNGQLDFDETGAHKVEMGATFSVVLNQDGTVSSHGLLSKYANEIAEWEGIVDIAVGNGHVMALTDNGKVICTGNDNLDQCLFDGETDVSDIYADGNASFIVHQDGTVESCGNFLGRSQMKSIPSLLDVALSEEVSAYLTKDHKVVYHSASNNFKEVGKWTDIIDVAVGDEFIAGLDEQGHVHIDIQNYKIKDEVATWENIVAIAAGKDYLVAYDGQTIKGVGNNAYHQFDVSESQKIVLPAVTNIKISIDDYNVKIQFDEVANAQEYRLELDAGIGYAISSTKNEFVIPVEKFEDGHEYIIKIVCVGDERYEVSPPTVISYRFSKPEIPEISESTETPETGNNSTEVEIPFTLDLLTGKTRASFEAYLRGFGVTDDKLHAVPSENICGGQEEIVEKVEGITDYETLTKTDLLSRDITYYYCKLERYHE